MGLRTVELAEAQALQRELLLPPDAVQKLASPLRLYLLGEYRDDDKDDEQRVSIERIWKQGE